MPRVTPVMPPILEAKSNQVIFSDLENSLRKREGIKSFARKKLPNAVVCPKKMFTTAISRS